MAPAVHQPGLGVVAGPPDQAEQDAREGLVGLLLNPWPVLMCPRTGPRAPGDFGEAKTAGPRPEAVQEWCPQSRWWTLGVRGSSLFETRTQ